MYDKQVCFMYADHPEIILKMGLYCFRPPKFCAAKDRQPEIVQPIFNQFSGTKKEVYHNRQTSSINCYTL